MPNSDSILFSCFKLSIHTPSAKLNNFSITIHDREWVEIVGKPGSGKSLLFHLLSLRTYLKGSHFSFFGHNLENTPPYKLAEIRQQIGCCSQRPILLEQRTVIENLVVPCVARNHFDNARENAESLLDRFDISSLQSIPICELSDHYRNLVAIIRAFIDNPIFIIIDSLFESIPFNYQNKISEILNERHDNGATILLFASGQTMFKKDATIIELPTPEEL